MIKLNTFMISALAVLMTLAGCVRNDGLGGTAPTSTRATQGSLVLMVEPNAPIADVPVPISFRLNEGRSRDYAAGNARYIDHIYEGSADKYAVADFYRLEMARSRWELVTRRGNAGVIILDFEKESEQCVITISSRFHLLRPTQVHVEMWTTGRLPSPPGVGP